MPGADKKRLAYTIAVRRGAAMIWAVNLPVELFLAVRYIRPQRNFVSAITVISILGVTLAVAVLILVLSVMSGFRKELTDKLTEFNAHITVTRDGFIEDPGPLVKEILQDPDVLAASPFVVGPVLVKFKERASTPTIKGIPAEGDDPVIPIKRYIRQEREGMRPGEFELRGDSVLVGDEWARLNGANVGDTVTIYAPSTVTNSKAFKEAIGPVAPAGTPPGGKATNAPGKPGAASAPQDPLPQQDEQETQILPTDMQITGIFNTGYYPIDSNFFIVSMESGQHFYQLNQGAHGIAVKVKDAVQAKRTADRLMAQWKNVTPPLRARTWMDQNKSLVGAVATERVVMAMILFVVMVVAAFGLCSTLITVTVQKSGEIGILKAMGANDMQVGSIFALYGLVVGVAGSVAGVSSGLYCLYIRNDFLNFLSYRFGIEAFPRDIYGFTNLPSIVEPSLIILVVIAAIGTCVTAAFLPAMRAAFIDPVKALRHE